jgi:hypothetical protein
MWRCSDELRARADELHRSSKKDAKHYIGKFGLVINIVCYLNSFFNKEEKTNPVTSQTLRLTRLDRYLAVMRLTIVFFCNRVLEEGSSK